MLKWNFYFVYIYIYIYHNSVLHYSYAKKNVYFSFFIIKLKKKKKIETIIKLKLNILHYIRRYHDISLIKEIPKPKQVLNFTMIKENQVLHNDNEI